MHLVALAQPAQDRDGVLDARLAHQHLLEAALQRGVLLDVLPVLVQGGRADAAQLAAGQHRLEQVPGIHRPLGGAGPHHGMDLIDEQHNAALGLPYLGQHRLQPLLELAAVLGTCDQRPHVQGHDPAVAQRLRHVAAHDPGGQALHDRRLADARLADQHRIVLGPPAEDLHHTADLLVAADHRIEAPRPRRLGEVAPVAFQGLVGPLRIGAGHPPAAAHALHGGAQLLRLGPGTAQQVA